MSTRTKEEMCPEAKKAGIKKRVNIDTIIMKKPLPNLPSTCQDSYENKKPRCPLKECKYHIESKS